MKLDDISYYPYQIIREMIKLVNLYSDFNPGYDE